MAVIDVRDLRRAYGSFEALRGVSFSVERGEIVGLLGPNGAGKTTTMKVLTGFLAPTSGAVAVAGHDVLSDPVAARRQLGYLPENAPIYEDVTVRAYLGFVARVRGLGAAERARAIDRVTEATGLRDRLRQRVGTLSRGYRQRVGLAQALLHEPPILILDEPTTGLDPNQIVEIRALVREVGATRTVILSTHILPEVEVTCDRVLIIHQGRLVADDATEAIVAATAGHALVVGLGAGKVVAPAGRLAEELRRIPGVRAVEVTAPHEEAHRFRLQADRDVRAEVFRWAVDGGHVLVELSPEQRPLEEVFRRLTEEAA